MSGVGNLLGGLLVPFKEQFRVHLPHTDGPGTMVRTGGQRNVAGRAGDRAWLTTLRGPLLSSGRNVFSKLGRGVLSVSVFLSLSPSLPFSFS